jgi:hypothetical protein
VTVRGSLTLTNGLLNLGTYCIERNSKRLKRFGGNAFTFMYQPEQNVLSADVVVIQHASLFLGQNNYPASSICKPLKHEFHLSLMPKPKGNTCHVRFG